MVRGYSEGKCEVEVRETGIIMSGDHPIKCMDGTKTMTRRTWGLEEINKHPDAWEWIGYDNSGRFSFSFKHGDRILNIKCPYGQVGDLLVIKEAWAADKLWDEKKPSEINHLASIWYPADGMAKPIWVGRTRSARFMCHWMSRDRPGITEVRVERVQEIIYDDCYAEGIDKNCPTGRSLNSVVWEGLTPKSHFKELWDSLNAKRGYGWEVNPWCWCISFRR